MGKRYSYPHKDMEPIEEVFELYNFFSNLGVKTETALDAVVDYLQKGKTLVTLAKSFFDKRLKDLEVTDFEESLFSVEEKGDFLIKALAKKVIRKILKDTPVITDGDGVRHLDDAYAPYKQMMDYLDSFNVKISIVDTGCSYKWRFRRFLDAGDTFLKVDFEEGNLYLGIYGLKDHTHGKNNENILFSSGYCVGDIALFLSYLIVVAVYRKVTTDKTKDEYELYKKSFEKWIAGSARSDAYSKFCPYFRNRNLAVCVNITGDEVANMGKDIFMHRSWILPKDSDLPDNIRKYIEDKGVAIEPMDLTYDEIQSGITDDLQSGSYKSYIDIPVIIPSDVDKKMFYYDSLDMMDYFGADGFLYRYCLSVGHKTKQAFCMPARYNTAAEIVQIAFDVMHKKTHDVIMEARQLRNLASDYAKSYETKRNINKSTVEAMEKSIFNDYFGYVEFDNDVDLNKIKEIALEFKAFKDKYLSGIDSSENAIRFRKLGNHKASGLYYPHVKCLCVDISSPTSLVHEYGHLIDYCYGSLSRKGEFSSIRSLYEKLLRQAVRGDKELQKKMAGKSKYNMDYYLTPTEIFARCFEMYFKRALNVDNNLTPSCVGFEYPDTKEFNDMVKEYFDAILVVLNNENVSDEIMVATAASPR